MFKNVASQKITLLAIDIASNVPKTGDSANITAYVSKDDGAVTVLGDTTATELDATNAPGLYSFDLTQAETNADKLVFSAKSSTSGVKIVPVLIYTFPTTGILAPTVSGRTLDVSAGGEAGVDWANVGSPTTTVNLSGTTISTSQEVASVSGAVGSVTGSVGSISGVTFPSNFAALSITVGGAVTAGTVSDKTGYSISGTTTTLDALQTALNSAHGAGSWATATGFSTLDAAGVRSAVGLASANLDTQLGDLPTNAELATALGTADDATLAAIAALSIPTVVQIRTEIDSNSTQLAAIVADTNELQTDLANGGRLDLLIDAILDDTGTSGVVLSAAMCNKIADHVRRRTQANVEASSDGDTLSLASLYGLIQQAQESNTTDTPGYLTIKKTDGSTTLGTKVLTSDPDAEPVTGVS